MDQLAVKLEELFDRGFAPIDAFAKHKHVRSALAYSYSMFDGSRLEYLIAVEKENVCTLGFFSLLGAVLRAKPRDALPHVALRVPGYGDGFVCRVAVYDVDLDCE